MTSNNNHDPLAMLEAIKECSISGLFQELLNKGFKSSPATTAEPLKFGDSEGSDFKRLLHKKDKSTAVTTSTINQAAAVERKSSLRRYHQDSPDFRPAIHLQNNTTTIPPTFRAMGFGTALYSFFFQHEDRYFNHDRDELSKDIFPVGYQAQRG